ncbi:Myb_DNA-bind_6 domain-containing protein [Senna tora]|uniref:Myb_DNA-bind_6 domain-containing protein n=1 Tax=Senna tora TaxID=362788 RepID=A0A834THJ7_9FABA|nr:Myb_DNA-bind_6 domain-containing protein [Senna tora]
MRIWIGLKEGDFKRYSTKEPISMEAYSHEKAVKKISGDIFGEFILGQLGVNERLMAHVLSQMILPKTGTSNDPSNFDIFLMWRALKGWEPDLAFIILNHIKDTLARPNADLPYGSLITIIARYRGVVFIHDKFFEAAAQAIYHSRLILNMSYRKIDAARRKSSRLLKKESPTPSSLIQVSEEEKATEEENSDATMYYDSLTPSEKTEDTMHSSSSDEKPPQDDLHTITSQRSATDPASGHEPENKYHPARPSPKTSTSSLEPTPAPLTHLAEIRAHFRSLTAQVTTALEEIQDLKKLVTEMTLTIGNTRHPDPSNATPSSTP